MHDVLNMGWPFAVVMVAAIIATTVAYTQKRWNDREDMNAIKTINNIVPYKGDDD